jgi:hypothetical protein
MEGRAWTMEGMRHDHWLSMLLVPYVSHAAMMEPKYQVVLY